jgi:serine phosphatase RsbU (regulator of sigma subunit)
MKFYHPIFRWILFKDIPESTQERKNDLGLRIAFIFLMLATPYIVVFQCLHLNIATIPVLSTIAILLISVIFHRIKWHSFSKSLLVIGPAIGFFIAANVLTQNSGAQLLLFTLVPFPVLLFETKQVGWIIGLITVPMITYFTLEWGNYAWLPYHEIISNEVMFYIRCSAILTGFLLLILSSLTYFISTRRYELKIEAKNRELEEKNQIEHKLRLKSENQAEQLELAKVKTDKELKMAGKIQAEILPSWRPMHEGYHFDHVFLPAGEVSGDYYDYVWISPMKLSIIIADIVGKGVPASMMMVAFKEIFHHNLSSKYTPTEFIKKLNIVVLEKQIISKYVPLIYVVIDFEVHTMTAINAGHEPGKLFTSEGIKDLSLGGPPIGLAEDSEYEEEVIPIKPGFLATLFTDGLTDMRNKEGEQFGIDNLTALFQAHLGDPKDTFIPNVIAAALDYFKDVPQADDITLLTIKRDLACLPNT